MPMLVIVLTLAQVIYNAINLIIVQRSTVKTVTHRPGYKATVTVPAFTTVLVIKTALLTLATVARSSVLNYMNLI